MEIYGYLIQEWTDLRLKRKPGPVLIGKDKSLIWIPDVYCSNCRVSEVGGDYILRIDDKGQVYFSQK